MTKTITKIQLYYNNYKGLTLLKIDLQESNSEAVTEGEPVFSSSPFFRARAISIEKRKFLLLMVASYH